MVNIFLARSPISFEHMSFYYPFLDYHAILNYKRPIKLR